MFTDPSYGTVVGIGGVVEAIFIDSMNIYGFYRNFMNAAAFSEIYSVTKQANSCSYVSSSYITCAYIRLANYTPQRRRNTTFQLVA